MNNHIIFTSGERKECVRLMHEIKKSIGSDFLPGDEEKIRQMLTNAIESGEVARDVFGLNPVVSALQTALIAVEEEGVRREGVLAILVYACQGVLSPQGYESVSSSRAQGVQGDKEFKESEEFGEGVARIVRGLMRIQGLYKKSPAIETENFRDMLLSFAEDMRVILIMIADRVNLMRQIRDTDKEEEKKRASEEAAYLYAPLAHKLGLYKLKSELEDLSLKYLEHDAYYMIKEKLNATKKSRDAYIERFIKPVRERLEEAGLRFHMKGRTKSIHSIWEKMKKQQCGFEGIYDLFAIRIIIEGRQGVKESGSQEVRKSGSQGVKESGSQEDVKGEKALCWQAYSIVTDMYQPNPKRLRDWLSVPKSKGYESLHITVLGPEQKWVEVQIRTERMDEIAERGLAAHWRYKGVKSQGGLDDWLKNIRMALEAGDDMQMMDQFKVDLYEDEVFVFTPKGDLIKFRKGATVLDFAYHVHSGVGNTCTGARINGKVVPIREELHSGDTVEIITQSNQTPKTDWLKIVKTSRAKAKLRLALKEARQKDGLYAKEILERKFRNRKIELVESTLQHTIKKLGFKVASDFYKQIADEKLDPTEVIEKYLEVGRQGDRESGRQGVRETRSAEEFSFERHEEAQAQNNDDVLVIDKNLKGLDFTLAKCCHPIYGDPVFGFVTVSGGIKIHRTDCPNAAELYRRFGYRIVKAKWSGKGSSQYSITLRVVGNDDIGIVNNITSIISKEEKIMMRGISIDSHDGLFSGQLTVQIEDTSRLEALIKKLRTVKGVKQVERI